ncbi:MAG: tetratricopeptide repeat protein, partial [Planctomycetota bacterium]
MPETKTAKPVFSDSFDNPHYGQVTDELPDDEPLTPELVEEEAIRGDFMLRWAAIFLAILMAFGKLSDTKPLVLIKSGDAMRSNGFLPLREDPFSIHMENEGRPVENIGWLFDHIVSFAWMLGGPIGLTVLKVAVAALASVLLMRISIPGVSTWWNSICMVFAIVACSQDFMPVPELITVLGITLTMRLLFLHRIGQSQGLIWKLPVLTAVWCNLDPRAWVGAGVILAFAFGTSLARSIKGRSESANPANLPDSMIGPAVLSVLALLINPFHLSSLLSPLTTYSTEYPAMQSQRPVDSGLAALSFDQRVDWFSVLNPEAMVLFDHTHVAALAILIVAFVVLLLSRSARDTGFLFALGFVALLVLLAAHELPAAAIVAAVVASVTAQDWYRRSFSMKYSTDAKELLFSRGGRAATVLALAVLAFCVVASRLPGRMPLGFGFDKDTRITIDTLSEQFRSLPDDARILHTRIEQGDILIWNGRRSFIDSRIVPFGRADDPSSVFGQHRNVLRTLMLPPVETEPKSDDPAEKDQRAKTQAENLNNAYKTLDDFRISHVAIRFAPPGLPDYTSVRVLSGSGQWLPVSIGASAAVFERVLATMKPEDLARKAFSFETVAFRKADETPPGLRQFVTAPNFYDKYLYRTRSFSDADKRLVSHYLTFSLVQPQSTPEALSAIAKATLAVRHLNKSVSNNPNDVESLVLLGRAYMHLSGLEQIISGPSMSPRLMQVRQIQAICALRQAVKLDPVNLMAWDGLLQLHMQLNHLDLAFDALSNWIELAEKQTGPVDPQFEEYLTSRLQQKDSIEDQLIEAESKVNDTIKSQLEQMKASDAATGKVDDAASAQQAEFRDLLATASIWKSSGFLKRAGDVIEGDLPLLQSQPIGRFIYGSILLESGSLEEANRTLVGISQDAMQNPEAVPGVDWQLPTAISQMAVCDYDSAIETWSSQLKLLNTMNRPGDRLWTVAHTMPLVADANVLVNAPLPVWPFHNINAMGASAQASTEIPAEITLLIAMAQLEKGSNDEGLK